MTAASSQITSVSFRGVQVLLLNSSDYPNATDTSEYAGVRIIGAKALTMNRVEWERLTATGDDKVLAQFMLPPQEGASGELRTGAFDITAEALLTGLTAKTVGEAKMLPAETDISELPEVCLVAWREAKSVASGDEGRAHYEGIIIPIAKLAPLGGEWGERAIEERRYAITPSVVSAYPWGESLVEGTDGCTEMQYVEISTEYIPRIVAFQADGTATEFSFGTEAVNTDKVAVYVDGTEQTTGITVAVGSVTFDSAPSDGSNIVVFMEVEA